MNQLEVLMMIRRYRFLYVAVFIISFIAGVKYLLPRVLNYDGESTFYLANESLVNPAMFSNKNQQDFLQVSVVQERVYQLAYSSEMMNYLIQKFNLYHHYGIDTTGINFYAKTVKRITKAIRLKKISPDVSSIIVTDRNNEVAANMANAIVSKLDLMNKKYLIDKIQANLNFYDSFVKEAANISKEQNQKLFEYMEVLNKNRQKGGSQVIKPLSEIEFSLYGAATQIEQMTTQLILARNLYINALSAQKAKNLPSLVVIKRALPDISSKKTDLAIFSGLLAILGTTLAILATYVLISNSNELMIVFGRNLPETITDSKVNP